MVYAERNTWASLIASAVGVTVYVIVVLQQAGGSPLERVDWAPIMLWTIGGSILAAIVLSILWGIVARMRDADADSTSDVRDRDISQIGDRVGQAFLVLGALGALLLCAVRADWFWIAQALFFGFALSALVGGAARVVLYRRGMP